MERPADTIIRGTVDSWDQRLIYVRTEQGVVTVVYGDNPSLCYLNHLLQPGMAINVITADQTQKRPNPVPPRPPSCPPRGKNPRGGGSPEGEASPRGGVEGVLIIIEPDFLMETSMVAACFARPDDHPLAYTVRRMQPRALSQAILLGNFAGIALDDILTTPPDCYDVNQSIRHAFRTYALQFCACPEFNAQKFVADAHQQAANLQQLDLTPKRPNPLHTSPGGGFSSPDSQHRDTEATEYSLSSCPRRFAPQSLPTRDCLSPLSSSSPLGDKRGVEAVLLTEPSFLCPALGLMGRVDLMASDFSLLVEQKSGRNYRIERQAAVGGRDDHYIQLLLYYGILRYNFGLPYTHADIRLLYSKYPPSQGLLRVGFSMVRFAEAIRMRNTLVAWEYHIARQGFGSVLPTLSTTDHGLQSLSPIAQTYLSRMMTFVYREQLCAKATAADLWRLSAQEKHLAGTLISDLSLAPKQPTPLHARPKDACKARTSPGGGFSSPDSQHRDTEYSLSSLLSPLSSKIPLSSKTPLSSSSPSGDKRGVEGVFRPGDSIYLYAYEGDNPDITAAILYKGTLVSIQQEEIVVATAGKPPFTDKDQIAIEPAPADTTINSHIRALRQFVTGPTAMQQLLLGQRPPRADQSVTLRRSHHPDYDDVVLRACQARDYFLLVGPPGTGKTTMAMRFLVEELLDSQHSILLTAFTNRAVDEICAMLTAAHFPFLRLGNMSSSFEALLDSSPKLSDLHRHIAETPIIVATTSWLQSQPAVLSLKRFTAVIADEASQLTEPAIVGLLAQTDAPFILIGDHKQLPAVVTQPEDQSAVTEPELRAIGIHDCRESLFQRLLRWERLNGRTAFVGTLHRQGRMHPDIAHFPATMFYADEQLTAAGLPHQQATTLGYNESPTEAPLIPRGGRRGERCFRGERREAIASRERLGSEATGARGERFLLRQRKEEEKASPRGGSLLSKAAEPSVEGVYSALDDLLQTRRVLFIPVEPPPSTLGSAPRGEVPLPSRGGARGGVCNFSFGFLPPRGFLPLGGLEGGRGGSSSCSNPAEARMVAHLLHRLHHFLGSRFNAETVGVIVPYRSQISAIRNALQQYPSSLPPITIDTVERYQGSQRDVIIYSFTATHPDQLEFLTSGSFLDGTHTIDRRLNVVMTRARKQLLLVGDPTLLSQNPIYRQLISLYGIKATIQLSHV